VQDASFLQAVSRAAQSARQVLGSPLRQSKSFARKQSALAYEGVSTRADAPTEAHTWPDMPTGSAETDEAAAAAALAALAAASPPGASPARAQTAPETWPSPPVNAPMASPPLPPLDGDSARASLTPGATGASTPQTATNLATPLAATPAPRASAATPTSLPSWASPYLSAKSARTSTQPTPTAGEYMRGLLVLCALVIAFALGVALLLTPAAFGGAPPVPEQQTAGSPLSDSISWHAELATAMVALPPPMIPRNILRACKLAAGAASALKPRLEGVHELAAGAASALKPSLDGVHAGVVHAVAATQKAVAATQKAVATTQATLVHAITSEGEQASALGDGCRWNWKALRCAPADTCSIGLRWPACGAKHE